MSHQLFRESFTVPRFLAPLAREVVKMARCLNNLYGTGGLFVLPNASGGLDIDGELGTASTAGIDLSMFALGINSAELGPEKPRLELNSGICTYSKFRNAVGEKEVKLTGHPAFVILKIDRQFGGASWEEKTLSTIPANSREYLYIPYYEYERDASGVYSLVRIHRLGSFENL